MASDPKQVQAVFLAAVEKSIPSERNAALDRECGDNAELRRRVEALLFAHDHPESLPHAAGALLGDTNAPSDLYCAGAVIAGRYKLLEQIGEGGMGAVWVAEQTDPVRRRVALKLIKPGMDTKQVLSRFAAERQALALMDHPNIAKVFDGGMTDEGRPYFVMEYVKGVPFTEYCDQAKLSIEERLKLFLSICQAVQHAHQKGVIHRDLKPSNVLVCPYDGQPVPKVIDFGLAKAISQPLTEHTLYTAHGIMVGTPLYMSPEQAEFNNLDVDTRTDIYSLGVILYELLTGATPLEKQKFKDAAFAEILRLIKEVEPPKPSTKLGASATLPAIAARRGVQPAQLDRLVRGELDWIVMKCLEKDRSRRYETANGLARDVERYLHDELVEARPPSATYRLGKLARKHQTALTVASSIALLLIAATALSAWQATRALAAEQQAILAAQLANQAKEAEAQQRQKAEAERNRAEDSEKTAIAEKSNAQAALDYISNDILSYARPDFGGDPDIKLRTVVDNIAASLDAKSGKSTTLPPLVEATLRQTLWSIYVNLERFPEAAVHIKRAYEIRKELLGERNPETISAMVSYGYRWLWREGVGPDKEKLLIEGEKIATEALRLANEVLGPSVFGTLIAVRNVADYHSWWGRYAEAEKLYLQFLDGCIRTRGESDTWSIRALNDLAWLNASRKKLPEAEAYAKRAVELRTAQSEDHYLTYLAIEALAVTYTLQKQYAKAEQLQPKLIEGFRKHVGDRSLSYLCARTSYAFILSELDKHEQAVREYEEAIPLLRQSADYLARRRGTQLAFDLTGYGYCLNELGRFQDAEPVLREAMNIREADLGFYSPQLYNSRSVLGVTLTGLKRYEEAEQLLLTAYEQQLKPPTIGDPSDGLSWRVSTLERLIKLYMAWEKPGKVAQWQPVLDKLNEVAPQPAVTDESARGTSDDN